jgi:glycosyltransferase involved in cell wall biosynthesis
MGVGSVRLPHLLRAYLSIPAVTAYLRRARPEVLFATSIPPNLASLGGHALAKTPTAIVIRQSNVVRLTEADRYADVRRRPRDWILPKLYRRADAIIAVSAGVADNLRLLRAGKEDRIVVVPNGVALDRIDVKAAEPVDHPWPEDSAEPVLVAVGRLVAKKDYPTLLEALFLVRRSVPARLIILGEGPERGRLEGLARKLGIEQHVSMPGFCDNPFAYLARANLYVLSSISEGTSMITENVFEARFRFVEEMMRLGADARTDGHHAVVRGVECLSSAPVWVSDIRAGAGLVLAGLCADSVTEVWDVFHIDRGYPRFVEDLNRIGARVERVAVPPQR